MTYKFIRQRMISIETTALAVIRFHPAKPSLTYTRNPTSTTSRFIWNCKQIHNKIVIFCNICQQQKIYTKLCTPHDFIKSICNGTADLKPHPHTRDIINITICPVWASHQLTISCTECSYKVTNQIHRNARTGVLRNQSNNSLP